MKKTSELIWQDHQHQMLFELIDQINNSADEADVFERLVAYAEHHFALEEAYMEKLNYPHKAQHIKAHNRFREELSEMVANQAFLDDSLRKSLSTFLSEWLKRHVFGIDKDFEQFVLQSKSK
ncbi:hemerythrin family protein [Teredinibacter sp. KSP-S5-2]|uniref:hemerythrin family protein n=1 Tax=Teredinibacter sp. KSP-S5-2 TaxID=3034506 RepID=UPI002934ED0C|nr:hemerythrin family protein [Teredinibacter sp. KSP-S5-2]WNO09197.1 hemerythrin family protein [Teredinibacter sp. KSP-S5-2]